METISTKKKGNERKGCQNIVQKLPYTILQSLRLSEQDDSHGINMPIKDRDPENDDVISSPAEI